MEISKKRQSKRSKKNWLVKPSFKKYTRYPVFFRFMTSLFVKVPFGASAKSANRTALCQIRSQPEPCKTVPFVAHSRLTPQIPKTYLFLKASAVVLLQERTPSLSSTTGIIEWWDTREQDVWQHNAIASKNLKYNLFTKTSMVWWTSSSSQTAPRTESLWQAR